MTQLESRVAVLESRDKDTRDLLRDIADKLDSLTTAFQTRAHCPAPGSCISLKDEVKAIRDTLKVHEKEIKALATWRTFLVGGAAVIGILWAALNMVVKFI